MIKLRAATMEDAALMAPLIRESDVLELSRASHTPPELLLRESVAMTIGDGVAVAAVGPDGIPVALFGVGNYKGDVPEGTRAGVIWLIGSTELSKYPREFARYSKQCCGQWQTYYDHLFNFVDVDNTTARRWLKWLGFTETQVVPYGPLESPFAYFEYRKKTDV